MGIDFGKVERYVKDRGFGFVSRTFTLPPKEIFFHIGVINKKHPELAEALDNPSANNCIYFWYEFDLSRKGQEVVAILDLDIAKDKYSEQFATFVDIITKGWMDMEKRLSESFRKATLELLTRNEASQLAINRCLFEAEQKRHREEKRRAEAVKLQDITDQMAARKRPNNINPQPIPNQVRAQEKAEDKEFRLLVEEMIPLGFTHSREVSNYIVRHQLGRKYKTISGILQMNQNGDMWELKGGFPPKIYARLCDELGLDNQGSRATPGAFTPYKDIYD